MLGNGSCHSPLPGDALLAAEKFGALPSAESHSFPLPRCYRAVCGTLFLSKPLPLPERAAGCTCAQDSVSSWALACVVRPLPLWCLRLGEQLGWRDGWPRGTLAAGPCRLAIVGGDSWQRSQPCRGEADLF